MDKGFLEKVKRFTELSGKFVKERDQIIPLNTYSHIKGGGIYGGYNSTLYAYGNVTSTERDKWKELSIPDRIIGKAEQYAQLYNEYQEYWELRRYFYSYFDNLEKDENNG